MDPRGFLTHQSPVAGTIYKVSSSGDFYGFDAPEGYRIIFEATPLTKGCYVVATKQTKDEIDRDGLKLDPWTYHPGKLRMPSINFSLCRCPAPIDGSLDCIHNIAKERRGRISPRNLYNPDNLKVLDES